MLDIEEQVRCELERYEDKLQRIESELYSLIYTNGLSEPLRILIRRASLKVSDAKSFITYARTK